MKNIRIVAVMAFLCLVVTVNADAQATASPWYGGAKLGLIDVDAPFGLDEPVNLGLMVGYDLPQIAPNFSIEGEFTTSVVDGDTPVGDWSIVTLAAYGVFKPQFDKFYLKGKAGISFIDVDFPFGSQDEVELGLGFGGGMPISDLGSLELEYTFLELTDASYFSIGYVHRF